MTALIPAHINLNSTMGAIFIGLFLGAIFHGITTLQTVFYYTTYAHDKIGLKLLVAVLWVLDTTSLAFIAYALYKYLVSDFLDPYALEYMAWTLATEPIISGLIAFIVHEFLIYRIWQLNREYRFYAMGLAVISMFPLALALTAALKSVVHGKQMWTEMPSMRWISYSADISSSVIDILIAGTLCLQLHRSRTGFAKTDAMIQVLTIYTINTGLLPMLVNIGGLIAYSVAVNSLIFEIFNILVSKAYANTLLATLNSRQSIRGRGMETVKLTTDALGTAVFRADNHSDSITTEGSMMSGLPLSMPKINESKELKA